ncbi:MAG: DMP19 family protein [Bacteroidaceae bacterium]|nr:DMP19 family protein [Bacteroidaceae bacterium]
MFPQNANLNQGDPQLDQLAAPLWQRLGGELNAQTMARLSADETTLLAYSILREELLEGGFVQLIQNGYGPFIFLNPFAKVMRLWGLKDFSKWLYDARAVYEQTRAVLEQPTESDDAFMALYEQHPEWDPYDDWFVEAESELTCRVCEAYEHRP